MDLTKLQQINDNKAQQAKEFTRKTEQEIANIQLQETIVKVVKSLVEFLEGHTSKTIVVNQLREISTPDVKTVESAVNSLHETLKTHENTDITPLVDVMNSVLGEVKSLPKDKVDIKIPEAKDYSKDLKSLATLVKSVEKAIKSQSTTVEAPIVNVDAPVIEAPDLKPLTKDIKAVEKAIKSIVIPKPLKTDTSKIEKELKSHTKLLKDIREVSSSGSGGGGGGGIGGFMVDGALPITGSITATATADADYGISDIDDSTSTEYYGFTDPDANWLVKKITSSSVGWATVTNNGGVSDYATAWSGKASLTYGRKDEAF